MKRILQIVGGMDRAGAETMIMNLYRNIDRNKFQFDFIYFTSKKCDYDDEIIRLGGRIHRVIAFNTIQRTYKIYRFLKNNSQYKAIHCHMLLYSGFIAFSASFVKNLFFITHSHNTQDISIKGKFSRNLYHLIAKRLIDVYSDCYIACGRDAANFLFPYQKDIIILPNAIDVEIYKNIALNNKNYLTNQFDIDENAIKIIQVGRLEKVKNHIFSIKLAKTLKEQHVLFKMIFVGQGRLEMILKQKVKELQLENDIIFTGIRSDVPYLMSGADIMIMPSIYEGFPVVLVESQTIGLKALISSSISKDVDLGVELIDFIDLNVDIQIWVDRLCYYFEKKNLQFNLESLSRIKKEGFDINEIVRKLEDLYINKI